MLHFNYEATRGSWSIFNIVACLGLLWRKKSLWHWYCEEEDGGGNWRPDRVKCCKLLQYEEILHHKVKISRFPKSVEQISFLSWKKSLEKTKCGVFNKWSFSQVALWCYSLYRYTYEHNIFAKLYLL